MKIKYQFATETVEIEVSDDWGNLVIDLDRQEYNNDHKETRRHCSYDALGFDGDAMYSEDADLLALTENDDLHRAIAQLPQNQQDVIHAHFFEGLSFTEIAHRMGITPQAVRQTVERAKKQIRKNISDPV